MRQPRIAIVQDAGVPGPSLAHERRRETVDGNQAGALTARQAGGEQCTNPRVVGLEDFESALFDRGTTPAQADAARSMLRAKVPMQRLGAAEEVARAVLPRNTVATCDAGASRLLVVQKWESYGPREFLTSNGLASMGYAVPGAMGARLAFPDRPILAFSGDGGVLMAIADLQTAWRENLPIIVLVLDDQEIGLIRVKQEIKGVPPHGIHIGGVDWEKLGQAFGADAVVVRNDTESADALAARDPDGVVLSPGPGIPDRAGATRTRRRRRRGTAPPDGDVLRSGRLYRTLDAAGRGRSARSDRRLSRILLGDRGRLRRARGPTLR